MRVPEENERNHEHQSRVRNVREKGLDKVAEYNYKSTVIYGVRKSRTERRQSWPVNGTC